MKGRKEMNWTDLVFIGVNAVLSVALTVVDTMHYRRKWRKAATSVVTPTPEVTSIPEVTPTPVPAGIASNVLDDAWDWE
jgi:hypothetical protein